ncbi:diflavin oxidoreductase [Marinomonas colpomeniae]|uniref:Sulfite reductase flavoprotein subunit alpha n=1 Tax=Marinomonas colpomeniae TaxID=2774408 RepID=A0ABR8NW82_9GAMM|nr:sulfite reductase flavoprotein subunit alpha [Marinomonas colpomeniae]MBD5770311.1 sulfite reductase flavoprotein subunit alpha [Marinomonas colpomeniae]
MSNSMITQLSAVIESKAKDGNTVVELPNDAPFDPVQREWLNGLLTGISTIAAAAQAGPKEKEPGTPLSIFYGSQSGSSEVLSKDLKKFAATQGFDAKIEELDSVDLASMAVLNHVLIICSTFGEGEPPDNAKKFYENLLSNEAPALPATLNFAVCGLGDSSYTYFNKAAEDIYSRMAELGASPCKALLCCDLAFEDDYAEWKGDVFQTEAFVSAAGAAVAGAETNEQYVPAFDKNHPFIANLIQVKGMSGDKSAKCVNHVEISLAGGGVDLDYQAGDVLGVWPLNCPEDVNAILNASPFTGSEIVELKSGPASLRVLLQSKMDIHTVNGKTLEAWGIDATPDDYQVLDVMSDIKPDIDAQTFLNGLRPLQPRLYSIASSPKAHPGEVHLTVGEVRYDLFNKPRKGVASTWLGERLPAGSNVGVYIQSSLHFHIPDNDDAPLIMIGPGTGVAPFRAFLEERETRQAAGPNWLFFGDQHEAEDFLYRDQISKWQEMGVLTKASLAWSRDTAAKVYVQTLIREQNQEFYAWLEQGGYIYICGDASRMAADVDTAIRDVIKEQGNLDDEGVQAYMDKLVAEHRYQRDVY